MTGGRAKAAKINRKPIYFFFIDVDDVFEKGAECDNKNANSSLIIQKEKY